MQSACRVGRPQRPVAPGADPRQQLALALRKLREDSGNPTYRTMAGRAHYSASALARAASGTALPSRDLVLAYVQACGGDQEEWDRRWAEAAARAGRDDKPGHVQECDDKPGHDQEEDPPARKQHQGTPRRRPRRLVIAAAATATLALTAGILLAHRHYPVSHPVVGPPRARGPAGGSPPAVPVRRHGTLELVPGQVADLDTLGPGWGVTIAPGTAADDIWFSITDDGLHGNENADIAILPAGSPGTFSECAQEQDYGVTLNASRIQPGQLVCTITSDNRVALLRVTNVVRTANGAPAQVIFDAVVWVPPHKT